MLREANNPSVSAGLLPVAHIVPQPFHMVLAEDLLLSDELLAKCQNDGRATYARELCQERLHSVDKGIRTCRG